jgi:Reverse transcriptase (RNA-dependent DNA polymerase)
MRLMLAHAQLPEDYWNHAVQVASFIRNRLSNGPDLVKDDGSVLRQSPEQAWSKRTPRVNTLRVFSSKCFAYVDNLANKASQRGEVGIFLGYASSSQYWVEVVESGMLRRIDAARVLVDESIPGGTLLSGSAKTATSSSRVGEEYEMHDRELGGQVISGAHSTGNRNGQLPNASAFDCTVQPNVSTDKPEMSVPDFNESVGVCSQGTSSRSETVGARRQALTPKSSNDQNTAEAAKAKSKIQRFMEVSIPAEPKQREGKSRMSSHGDPSASKASKRRAEDDVGPEDNKKAKLTPQEVDDAIRNIVPEIDTIMAQITFLVRATEADQLDGVKNRVPIPTNYHAAVGDPIHGRRWQEAVQKELDGLIGNRNWQEEKLSRNANQVTSKWVFTVKYNIDGSIERYKARLIARRFTQIYGQDFEETFALTIRIDSLRMLMAIMVVEDMEVEQIDVNNAFTESKL